jgi:uncharacterized membrane protein
MATMTVWTFDASAGAGQAIDTLEQLQKEGLVTIHDAAIVEWEEGKKKPKTRQLHDLTGAGAMNGAFWGLLFGLLFFVPLLGAAVGAAVGGLTGSLADVGIDDRFIGEVRQKVQPGTSALFLLTSDGVRDRIAERFAGVEAHLVHTNLSGDDEAALREAFGA